MSYAPLENFFSCNLKRTLDPREVEMMRCMTAAGMAKINFDRGRGTSLLQTLAELKVAYLKMKQRRLLVASSLTAEAKQILSRMKRTPTTDELAMFAYMPLESLKKMIVEEESKGETFDIVIEDLALHYKHLQLKYDGQALTKDNNNLVVHFNRLVPTVVPPELDEQSPTVANFSHGSVCVRFSPHTVWFTDTEEENIPSFQISTSPFQRHRHSSEKHPATRSHERHCLFQIPTAATTTTTTSNAAITSPSLQFSVSQQQRNKRQGDASAASLPTLVPAIIPSPHTLPGCLRKCEDVISPSGKHSSSSRTCTLPSLKTV